MADSRDKNIISDLLEVFGKVDRIVAIAALALTYVSNSAKQPLLAIVFVVVACIALDAWLWRLATTRISTPLLSNQGQVVLRPRLAAWQSISLKFIVVLITLLATAFIVSVVFNPENNSTASILRPACKSPIPVEWNDMVCVPEGSFWMGTDDGPPDTRPKHLVFVNAFWIDKTEVTVAQYSKFLTNHPELPAPKSWEGGKKLNDPVVEVNWTNAQLFCHNQGKRLPTEAEWEKAARGEKGYAYPWGDQYESTRAISTKSALQTLMPAGSNPSGASPYGALDMASNAAEWVADYYAPDYYSVSDKDNPRGPAFANFRVVRGGSYNFPPDLITTYARLGIYPEFALSNTVGFRCVFQP